MLNSQIVISADIEITLESLKQDLNPNLVRVIKQDEFKIDDSKSAIREAYISSEELKYIFLVAKSFNIYAQNSLLKILEEPPKNIVFIIITNSKSALLPTIKSRLPISQIKGEKVKIELGFTIRDLTLKDIYNFLKEHKSLTQADGKLLIEAIFEQVAKEEIKLTERELDVFSNSFKLIKLNSKPVAILSNIMLTILNRVILS